MKLALEVAGIGLIFAGVLLFSVPAALVVLGALIIVVANTARLPARQPTGDGEDR